MSELALALEIALSLPFASLVDAGLEFAVIDDIGTAIAETAGIQRAGCVTAVAAGGLVSGDHRASPPSSRTVHPHRPKPSELTSSIRTIPPSSVVASTNCSPNREHMYNA
ncbi:hypothetical protein NJ7G_1772 [Natrinema sp. J7-2]|nr:hypothetical protein NJ7G_1772 [Natrinema sp. J7-2]